MAKNEIPDFEAMARTVVRDARAIAETRGEEFFKETFDKGGFTDSTFEQWTPAKHGMPGYKTLLITGALQASVGVMQSSDREIHFGSDMPYAEIHNEGGVINVTVSDKMRKYFWFMFKATGKAMWKHMALTKKDKLQITIPQRRFVGHSDALMAELDAEVSNMILTRFKAL